MNFWSELTNKEKFTMKFDLNVLLFACAMLICVFPVSAASAGNQSVNVGCNVQPYIGLNVNPNSVTWGNVTPEVRSISSISLCIDNSNVPINVYTYMPEPFSGPETVNQSCIENWGTGTPVLWLQNCTVPVNGTSYAYDAGSPVELVNGVASESFGIKLPFGVLPGNYNTTLYNYCEAYTNN